MYNFFHMETVKIKHREFQIKENVNENQFIGLFKGKEYLVYHFDPISEEGKEYIHYLTRITNTGIRTPKLYWLDKKAGYSVRENLIGRKASEVLSEGDLSEKVYEDLFFNNYMAKMSHMTLNYSPENWLVVEEKLYYMINDFIVFEKSKDLVDKYIRLWFNTKEFADFCSKNGLNYDKKRIKDEYSTNKEIVLMTCKYYR